MPALENARHEKFAQELSKGKTADEAYVLAGLDKVVCGVHAGFYVYALIDPRNDQVFYIGKGKGRRYAAHLREYNTGNVGNAAKFDRIAEIVATGLKPLAVCLAEGLEEGAAYSLERGFIQAIGRSILTNDSGGQRSEIDKAVAAARFGLAHIMPLSQWMAKKRRLNRWIVSPEADVKLYWQIVGDFREMAGLSHANPC